jgi:hypothetical protein
MSVFHGEGLPERVAGSKPARSGAAFISSAADERRLRIIVIEYS